MPLLVIRRDASQHYSLKFEERERKLTPHCDKSYTISLRIVHLRYVNYRGHLIRELAN